MPIKPDARGPAKDRRRSAHQRGVVSTARGEEEGDRIDEFKYDIGDLSQVLYDNSPRPRGDDALEVVLTLSLRRLPSTEQSGPHPPIDEVTVTDPLRLFGEGRVYPFRLGDEELYVNIKRVTEPNPPRPQRQPDLSLEQVLGRCKEISRRIERDREPRIAELQALVADVGGRSFESLHANKVVASTLEALAQSLGVRFACPRQIQESDRDGKQRVESCGQPATLDCVAKGGTRFGSFVFRHPLQSRKADVHASSTILPANLQLIEAHLDRRKKHLPTGSQGPVLG